MGGCGRGQARCVSEAAQPANTALLSLIENTDVLKHGPCAEPRHQARPGVVWTRTEQSHVDSCYRTSFFCSACSFARRDAVLLLNCRTVSPVTTVQLALCPSSPVIGAPSALKIPRARSIRPHTPLKNPVSSCTGYASLHRRLSCRVCAR